jgi:serine-type D-Ala-D-Ala endopeptidase (penicillin-binding protein 7)
MRWIPTILALCVALAPLDAAFAKKPKAKAKARAAVVKIVKAKKRPAVVAKARAPAPEPLRLVDGKPLLQSSVAYVIDQDTGEVLLGKNDEDVRPIASLTKLMSGLVLAEAKLPMDERITVTDDDVDRLKNSSSRLRVGTVLTRREAIHISLMSSENRATHALARTYPGGVSAFVAAMNNMARKLGMDDTQYVEPTGLSSRNRSSAQDLAVLAATASENKVLQRYSTSPGYRLGDLQYVNSNRLLRKGWDMGVQKTGYIREAGPCLLLQTRVDGRKLIMVFLDAASKVSRFRDAEMVRRWVDAKR